MTLNDEYLIKLQKLNKYIKENEKDDPYKQELKARENQFSIYINGANATKESPPKRNKTIVSARSNRSENSKYRSIKERSCYSNGQDDRCGERSRSAPSWGQRRYWGQPPVQIKTKSGHNVHLQHPTMSTNYSDNFTSSESSSLDEELDESLSSKSDICDIPKDEGLSLVNHTELPREYKFHKSEDETVCDSKPIKQCRPFQGVKSESIPNLRKVTSRHETLNQRSSSSRHLFEDLGRERRRNVLRLLFFSNWSGNENGIGLTELQLYDSEKKLIQISDSDISVENASIVGGELSCLVNKITKTVNSRNMVLFRPSGLPMSLNIKFPSAATLSRISVWNYNEASYNLKLGVKFCKIFLNGNILFEGNIDKGCGNKVFEYVHYIQADTPTTKMMDDRDYLAKVSPHETERRITKPCNQGSDSKNQPISENVYSTEIPGISKKLSALSFFDSAHLGRLETSIDFKCDVAKSPLKQPEIVFGDRSVEILNESEDFEIPILPEGKELTLNIQSTWGDVHYVGLNGIEVFGTDGKPVEIANISANPSDVNVLNKHGSDPRVVSNLIDGNYLTNDDFRMWLTPFTTGTNHLVHLSFKHSTKIAMIRIWNYNKSRIHSYRGAKDVIITLDSDLIFKGRIVKASGTLDGSQFGDTILFTTDECVLENVSKYDSMFTGDGVTSASTEFTLPFARPNTGRRVKDSSFPGEFDSKNCDMDANCSLYCIKKIEIKFLSSWGDENVFGLTGIELLGETESVPLSQNILSLKSSNPEFSCISGHVGNLINGINFTTLKSSMMLVPFYKDYECSLQMKFPQATQVRGIRFWNYNESSEESYKGIKSILILLDDACISSKEGVLLRRAPGNMEYDFAQDVMFTSTRNLGGEGSLDSVESSIMPTGFVFQIRILNSISDPYYVGLNGLEVFNSVGKKIMLSENNIAAYPESINILDDIDDDARTPDKLIDGVNDTDNGQHMWLCPLIQGITPKIFIIFDQPVTLSMIKIWNYSKTTARGVRDFALEVDGFLVHSGTLNSAIARTDGVAKQVPSLISFTEDRNIMSAAGKCIYVDDSKSNRQEIKLMDKQPIFRGHDQVVNPNLRPMTTVTGGRRTKLRSRF